MRSTLDKLLLKLKADPLTKTMTGEGIELISDAMTLQLRGGDKDYSPTYEYKSEQPDKFTDPTILLNM